MAICQRLRARCYAAASCRGRGYHKAARLSGTAPTTRLLDFRAERGGLLDRRRRGNEPLHFDDQRASHPPAADTGMRDPGSSEHRILEGGEHAGLNGIHEVGHGGPYRTRTCDPLRVMQVRYQLRQRPR